MKKTIAVLVAIMALFACSKSTSRNTYFRLEQGSFNLNFEFFGGIQSYVVYSDYERWTFKVSYDEPVEEEWVKMWPYECEADSRFNLKVFPNQGLEPRKAVVGIVVGGKVLQEIHIEQGGTE